MASNRAIIASFNKMEFSYILDDIRKAEEAGGR